MKNRSTKKQVHELARRSLDHVNSVPYKVSLRWVFYRLLQEGLYKSKADYTNFVKLVSKWRHEQTGGWYPDTLADETRESILQGVEEMTHVRYIPEDIIRNLNIWTRDSHFKYQHEYVEIWFEARAMLGQFKEYAKNLVLCPFVGYAGIDFKHRIAKRLGDMDARFKLPITILYFGDCDKAGRMIAESSVNGPKGLKKWCNVPFNLVWCGLTLKQAKKYRLPENIEKPGEYQWEALNDAQAKEIIEQSIDKHIDQEAILQSQQDAEELNEVIAFSIRKAFKHLHKRGNLNE